MVEDDRHEVGKPVSPGHDPVHVDPDQVDLDGGLEKDPLLLGRWPFKTKI